MSEALLLWWANALQTEGREDVWLYTKGCDGVAGYTCEQNTRGGFNKTVMERCDYESSMSRLKFNTAMRVETGYMQACNTALYLRRIPDMQ